MKTETLPRQNFCFACWLAAVVAKRLKPIDMKLSEINYEIEFHFFEFVGQWRLKLWNGPKSIKAQKNVT